MARTRTRRQPPKEVESPTRPTAPDEPALASPEPDAPPAPAPEPAAPPARRMGVAEYISTARLPPTHASILRVLHATTKATRDEWAAHLAHALTRPTR